MVEREETSDGQPATVTAAPQDGGRELSLRASGVEAASDAGWMGGSIQRSGS